MVDRRCEGNTVILWHDSQKSRFKSDGQEDAINGNWKRCDHIRNVINSQSKIKLGSHKIETPPWPTPKKLCINTIVKVKVKWSRYRPGVAQRVGRGIALLFHDRGTRRGWVVSSTPRPQITPGKDPVPILEEAGWAPAPVWTGVKSRPHRDSIPDRPARSESLYRLSYRAHINTILLM